MCEVGFPSWGGQPARGGLLFALFFLGLELTLFRKAVEPSLSRTRKIGSVVLFVFAIVWFGAASAFHLLGDRWQTVTDYFVLALYIGGLATVLFGLRGIREVRTSIVFSACVLWGNLLVSLTPAYPHGTVVLCPLPPSWWTAFLHFVVAFVAWMGQALGLPIYGWGNMLTILGKHGTFRLIFYGEGIGLTSLSIFMYLVITMILVTRVAGREDRVIAYWLGGIAYIIAGFVFLNVGRLFLIAYYGCMYATSGVELDAIYRLGYSMIGELFFPLWILAFIVIIRNIEAHRQRHVTIIDHQQAS